MSQINSLGFGSPRLELPAVTTTERIIIQRPLQTVLAFLGRSIDEVCLDPIIKNEVYGYYKLHKQILRTCEINDLERWWNSL